MPEQKLKGQVAATYYHIQPAGLQAIKSILKNSHHDLESGDSRNMLPCVLLPFDMGHVFPNSALDRHKIENIIYK